MLLSAALVMAHLAAPRARAADLEPVALLPGVGSASAEARRQIDGALRDALLDAEGFDLLAPVDTRQHLMSLAEMGLVCMPEDLSCMVKLGIVAGVSWVLVPVVDRVKRSQLLRVEIGVVDVAAAQRARTVEARVRADDAEAIVALARRALALPELAGAPTTAAREAPPAQAPPAAEAAPPAEAPAAGPLSVGAIVTGVGAGVTGLALAGAIVCDAVFTNPDVDASTRQAVQPVGAALWVTSVVGAAALGTGVFLLVNPPIEPGAG